MATFIILAAVALCALLIGLVVTVGDKTPAVAAAQTDLSSIAPQGAMDWAAVRALIIGTALRGASRHRRTYQAAKAAKHHRRWFLRAVKAEGRAQALAVATAARLEARTAAKAAQRAKSAAVALRYGHAAARGLAAVKAHRRLAAAGLATPAAMMVGIKAANRATRGSTSAKLAAVRAARKAAAQQRNAAARLAADAANAAFADQQAAKAADRKAKLAMKAKAADRKAKLVALLANRDAVRLARAVVRAGAKASLKEDFLQWLDENGHTPRGEVFVAANQAAWVAGKAEEGYLAHFGFSAECVAAADKAAFERRSVQRAIRKAAKAAQAAAKVAA